MTRPLRLVLPVLLALLPACDPQTGAPPAELARVSEGVQYASVDRLGPHVFLSSIVRTTTNAKGTARSSEEAVEIKWVDWNTFAYRRVVDGEAVMSVTTVEGRPYVLRPDGGATRRDDAEPYRIELRAGWDTWDQALSRFSAVTALTDQGSEVIEGRPARRFTVSLKAPPTEESPQQAERRAIIEREQGVARALSGTVWIDEATAVKLVADVTAEWATGPRVETVTLKLARSAIGQPLDLRAPANAAAAPLLPTEAPPDPAASRSKRPAPREP